MKVHIVMFYYNRPTMVRTALRSIREQTSHDWILSVIDDSSDFPAEPVVREELSDHQEKLAFVNTNITKEYRAKFHSTIGQHANELIRSRQDEAEIALILCDDDALYPDYIEKMTRFYQDNPDVIYAYSMVTVFDPTTGEYPCPGPLTQIHFNRVGPVSPSGAIDMCQCSWRVKPFIKADILFPHRQTLALDWHVYVEMEKHFGLCMPMKFAGVFKGRHKDQVNRRESRLIVNNH